jgi:mono/diheme cytochrome c family protein
MSFRLKVGRLMVAAGTLLGSGCGGAKTGASATPTPLPPALVITDGAEWQSLADAGKTSFDSSCGSCHPGGEADLGPSLKGHAIPLAEMTRQIREGSGRMKPIEPTQLPEDRMRGLMVYLSTLDAVSGVQGPPSRLR